jgi:hypothetical protein
VDASRLPTAHRPAAIRRICSPSRVPPLDRITRAAFPNAMSPTFEDRRCRGRWCGTEAGQKEPANDARHARRPDQGAARRVVQSPRSSRGPAWTLAGVSATGRSPYLRSSLARAADGGHAGIHGGLLRSRKAS